jgi:hypothetical protein
MIEIKTGIQHFTWKQKLVFGIVMGCFHTLFLWLIDRFVTDDFQTARGLIFQGVFFGIFMGFGMPFLMNKFPKIFVGTTDKDLTPDLEIDEVVKVAGGANLSFEKKRMGGKLFLTSHHLIFKPSTNKNEISQVTIPYSNIKEIEKRKMAQVFNNRIEVITNDGNHYSFTLGKRELWWHEISKMVQP